MSYVCMLTHHGWQLYEDEGVEAVAAQLSAKLTEAVNKAKEELRANPCLSEEKLAYRVQKEMREVMYRVGFGASDTEPDCVLVSELERAFGLERWSLDR